MYLVVEPISYAVSVIEPLANLDAADRVSLAVIPIFQTEIMNAPHVENKIATLMESLSMLVGSSGAALTGRVNLTLYNDLLLEKIKRVMDDTEEALLQ